ncbi:MAG: SDR family NAD(P)-dependent oxidoreductase [Amylibacter sp.]|nr:SDR family NAD(P)-dependent oxidoreductase [Amylibacter sp.]
MATFDLKDKTILVTGGGRGIGREIVRNLAGLGAHIIIVGRNQADLDQVAKDHPGQITTLSADLSKQKDVDRIIAQISKDHPNLSVLINNAGIQFVANLLSDDTKANIAGARTEVALNVDALMSLTIGLLPVLKAQPQAAVVNISSGLAIAPKEDAPIYSATKAAVRSFCMGLRYQCQTDAPHIQITEAIMDLIATDMTRDYSDGAMQPADAAKALVDGLQAGKPAIWIGRTKFLRIINLICPPLARKILR